MKKQKLVFIMLMACGLVSTLLSKYAEATCRDYTIITHVKDPWGNAWSYSSIGNSCWTEPTWEGGGFRGEGGFRGDGGGGGRGGKSNDSADKDKEEGKGDEGLCAGNPVIIASGNKIQPEIDFVADSSFPLAIEKNYNHFAARTGVFGKMWLSSFDYKLLYTSKNTCVIDRKEMPSEGCEEVFPKSPVSNSLITVLKPDGAKRVFNPSGINYQCVVA
jgi:hypothetical protein